MSSNECIPGVLSVLKLSDAERELFIDYLDNSKPFLHTDYLFAIFGSDHFLKFFDVFSGENIKVPAREDIIKIVSYIKIYSYCKSRNFSESSYEMAAKIYGKRRMSIKRIVEKVSKILEGGCEDADTTGSVIVTGKQIGRAHV